MTDAADRKGQGPPFDKLIGEANTGNKDAVKTFDDLGVSITDANGKVEEVKGLGLVGQQPLIQPGTQFEYSSWTRLDSPHGIMHGEFYCVTEDMTFFEAVIEPDGTSSIGAQVFGVDNDFQLALLNNQGTLATGIQLEASATKNSFRVVKNM